MAAMLAMLVALAVFARAEELRYWVEPCTRAAETACLKDDPQLADWALGAWQAASLGMLKLQKTDREERAHIRLYWGNGRGALYGEARPILVEGKRGAEVFVRPEVAASAKTDPLLRDAIVYLTCLHETGHALGLAHTAGFDDIMYSFQYGGDITEYFGRYRRKLTRRDDIRKNSGMSERDQSSLLRIVAR